jgi:hypothetical protein
VRDQHELRLVVSLFSPYTSARGDALQHCCWWRFCSAPRIYWR